VLFIEATKYAGSGNVRVTGNLGEVMQESAQIAVAWIRSHAVQLGLVDDFSEDPLKSTDIHVHFPAGAVPKDGPSAGVTITTCIVSLLTDRVVRPDTAMTGEISLRGQVMPVGGVKEKVLAAHRLGLRQICVPFKNKKDIIYDVPQEIQDDITWVYAETIEDILRAAFVEPIELIEDTPLASL
jgi:ATP-dependent Lon protease